MICCIRGHGSTRGRLRGAIDGGQIWWVAKDYSAASDVIWPDLKRATQHAWQAKSEVDRTIYLPGGGSISVRSADKEDSLRGPGLDGIVLDEAAFAKKRVWTEILRPMLSDKHGWGLLIGTPDGFNWFEELFRAAGADDNWQRWQRPTSDNPLVSLAELDQALADVGPHSFAQEYLAQFISVEGAEFPADYFGEHLWFDEWPRDMRFKTMALDPSKGRDARVGDYSAFVMLGRSREGLLYVDADMQRRPAEKIVQDGVRLYREFRPDGFAIETNQFQELLAAEFKREFFAQGELLPQIYHLDNRVNKNVRIRALGALLQARIVRLKRGSPGAALLLNQLREFPVGEHDDGPDALEMAARLMSELRAGPVDSLGNATHL